MLVRIPEHLRDLEVIDQLARLIQAYAREKEVKAFEDNSLSPLDYYYYTSSTSNVRKFLELYLPGKDFTVGIDDFDGYIDYLESRFYAVKGTLNVFTYMKEYLELEFTYSYTPRHLSIEVYDISTEDIQIFKQYLLAFLRDLLYFFEDDEEGRSTEIKIDKGTLTLRGTIGVELSYTMNTYLEQSVDDIINYDYRNKN